MTTPSSVRPSDGDGLAEAYRAPASDLDDDQDRSAEREDAGYVVSSTKLVLLFTATLGLYGVYWFYKHWQYQKLIRARRIWLLPRAILCVFYVVPLFKRLDLDARRAGLAPTWNPTASAALFIGVHIAGRALERLSRFGEGGTALALSSLLLPLVGVVPLLKAQQLSNALLGDPRGARNAQLGTVGVVVLLLGALAWPLLVVARLTRPH